MGMRSKRQCERSIPLLQRGCQTDDSAGSWRTYYWYVLQPPIKKVVQSYVTGPKGAGSRAGKQGPSISPLQVLALV